MSLCRECCMLSGRGLCEELITRPEESYRLWCVVVCDLETSRKRRPCPSEEVGGGLLRQRKKTTNRLTRKESAIRKVSRIDPRNKPGNEPVRVQATKFHTLLRTHLVRIQSLHATNFWHEFPCLLYNSAISPDKDSTRRLLQGIN